MERLEYPSYCSNIVFGIGTTVSIFLSEGQLWLIKIHSESRKVVPLAHLYTYLQLLWVYLPSLDFSFFFHFLRCLATCCTIKNLGCPSPTLETGISLYFNALFSLVIHYFASVSSRNDRTGCSSGLRVVHTY